MQKMVENLGRPFCEILGWPFLGDVLEKCQNRVFIVFAKMVENLGRLFCGILDWPFSGDVLDNPFW
jgi:hypothetical protein